MNTYSITYEIIPIIANIRSSFAVATSRTFLLYFSFDMKGSTFYKKIILIF